MCDRLTYAIAFSQLKGLNIEDARQILESVGSEMNFFSMSVGDLESALGVKSAILSDKSRSDALERARREVEYMQGKNIRPIFFTDADYPSRLLSCPDAPLMVFATGRCDFNASHIVGIVGTRHATAYGIGFVNEVVESLSQQIDDLIVVSGLAYGIDISAHRASLKHDVRTVGVVAHGLSTIYPAVHRSDAASMIKNGGAVLTEYLHDASIHKGNFLARNRIVAGMCDCLLVVESAQQGGALVTAKTAASYCRDVFALPGRKSDRFSVGCNNLITRNVATLVQSADDLIDAMCWYRRQPEGTQTTMVMELNVEEQAIVDRIRENGSGRADELAATLGMPMSKVLSTLIELEFKGALLSYPGGNFTIA